MRMRGNYQPLIQHQHTEPIDLDTFVEILNGDGFIEAMLALHGLAKSGFFELPVLDQQVAAAMVEEMMKTSTPID